MLVVKMPKEQRERIVEEIKEYFFEERGETLGNLAAEQILDFVMRKIGPFCYNQALGDARAVVQQTMAAAEDELYALEKPTGK